MLHRPGDTLLVADIISHDVFPPLTCSRCQEPMNRFQENSTLPVTEELKAEMHDELGILGKEQAGAEDWLKDDEGIV